jgi:lipopolysaccharide assembly protein A
MLRYVRYVLILAIGLVLLTLALANRAVVTVQGLPESLQLVLGQDWAWQMPLFLVIFGGVVLGLIIGFVWEWIRESSHRANASTRAREIARLERELGALRAEKGDPQDEVLALLNQRSI